MAGLQQEARVYLEIYEALVGAAYVLYTGEEQAQALLRAWRVYAVPLIDVFGEEEWDPRAYQAAQALIGFLSWLHDLEDPEAYFRDYYRKRSMARGLRPVFPQLRRLR